MVLDLSRIVSDKYRFGIDADKTASILESLAAQIRAGVVLPKSCDIRSCFVHDDFEAGVLVLKFHEKVET